MLAAVVGAHFQEWTRRCVSRANLASVESVPALAREALNAGLRDCGGRPSASDYEEALGFMLEVVVRLSRRYDPSRDRARERGLEPSFSNYAFVIGRKRVADWYRHEYGDSRYGERPVRVDEALPDVADAEDVALDWRGFSHRSRRIARLLMDGKTKAEIAGRLGLSKAQLAADIRRLEREAEARGLRPERVASEAEVMVA